MSSAIVRDADPRGIDKVTGAAHYAGDIRLPGCLVGGVLRSPYAHARIRRIDVSAARRVAGVRAVIAAADLGQAPLIGRSIRDVQILAADVVRFVVEKVAAVAGDDPSAVAEALARIEVEYEELPAVFDPERALEPDAPLLHPHYAEYAGLPDRNLRGHNLQSRLVAVKGDVDAGLRATDRVFEHEFRTPVIHQGYLGPHVCVVSAGTSMVEVWVSQKAPFRLRSTLSAASGLPESAIRVHPMPIGGDFGGKGSFMDVPIAYFLSRSAGWPVRIEMLFAEELQAANPRHAAVIRLRSGVDRKGRLVARDCRVIYNGGAYAGYKPMSHANLNGGLQGGGAYRVPSARSIADCVYTNTVPAGHARSPGEVQTIFAVESASDLIAAELGLDPLEFRRRNVLRDGDEDARGRRLRACRVAEVLEAAAAARPWSAPRPAGSGRGMAIFHRKLAAGSSTAQVVLDHHGALVRTALPDTGTGLHGTLREVVAREIGLRREDVHVEVATTDDLPPDDGIGATRVTILAGEAARAAAATVKAGLLDRLGRELGCAPETLRIADACVIAEDGRSFPFDEAIALARLASPIEATETRRADPKQHDSVSSAQIVDVIVDRQTGQVTVTSIVTAHDVGEILNPIMHQGQIDGGVSQGLGMALMEELAFEDGRATTTHLGDYKLPTQLDMPRLRTILVRGAVGPGPFNAKAIGEASVSGIAPAIANAVHDAVGVRIRSLPITAEKLWAALLAVDSRVAESPDGLADAADRFHRPTTGGDSG